MLNESERGRWKGREEGPGFVRSELGVFHEVGEREREQGVRFCVSRAVILASSVGAVSASSPISGVKPHTDVRNRSQERISSLVLTF